MSDKDYKALGELIGALIGIFVVVTLVICFILAPIVFIGMLIDHAAQAALIGI